MGISREQALDCFASDDLIGIGMEADAVRRSLHPEGVVTYSIDRRVSLAQPQQALEDAANEVMEEGGTGLTLQGAEGQSIQAVEATLRLLKQRFPQLRLHCFSAAEIQSLSEAANLSLADTLVRLKSAGLDSVPGDGQDLIGRARWLEVHRAAHRAGIPTTAAMTFGAGESMEDRVSLLESIQALQAETSGFTAFTLTSHHAPGGRDLDDATAVEYLKTLAICRMVLDNIPHLQTNWEQQGLKVLQMGLRFGGNDVGSILGQSGSASGEEVRRIIRDAGFRPVQRDTLYLAHLLG